jgi:hypothetical protein
MPTVTPLVNDATAWSRLWPLLVTAALTLLLTLWVQLYVVPRVETRKRRDDRWERDVLALGELLTFDQPGAANALGEELDWKVLLDSPPEDVSRQWLQDAGLRHQEQLRVAVDEYRRVAARVDWLIDRVEAIDKWAERMRPFVVTALRYRVAQQDLGYAYILVNGESSLAEDEVSAYREKERQAVRALVKTLNALAGHPPPATSLPLRIRRRWRYLTAPLSRWRVRKQVEKVGESPGVGGDPLESERPTAMS